MGCRAASASAWKGKCHDKPKLSRIPGKRPQDLLDVAAASEYEVCNMASIVRIAVVQGTERCFEGFGAVNESSQKAKGEKGRSFMLSLPL